MKALFNLVCVIISSFVAGFSFTHSDPSTAYFLASINSFAALYNFIIVVVLNRKNDVLMGESE